MTELLALITSDHNVQVLSALIALLFFLLNGVCFSLGVDSGWARSQKKMIAINDELRTNWMKIFTETEADHKEKERQLRIENAAIYEKMRLDGDAFLKRITDANVSWLQRIDESIRELSADRMSFAELKKEMARQTARKEAGKAKGKKKAGGK